TVTRAQSSFSRARCSKKTTGVVPPETARDVLPSRARRACKGFRTASAKGGARAARDGNSRNRFDPGAAVPLDQRDGGTRSPGAGCVGSRRFVGGGPDLQNRVDPVPGGF